MGPLYKFALGYCPICEKRTAFIARRPGLRDHFRCIRCSSIPRWRALIAVLESHWPDWRNLRIHESSPGGASSEKMARECRGYVGTQLFPGVPSGQIRDGHRCEDLQAQTFADAAFDLVVTQDVLEHVLRPERALCEIARTLTPGGTHLFTVPWFYGQRTRVRAVEENGTVRHLEPPEYHGNPIDAAGSLVVTEWGADLVDFIYLASGLTTTAVRLNDPHRGIEGKFIEVFISRKSETPVARPGAEAGGQRE